MKLLLIAFWSVGVLPTSNKHRQYLTEVYSYCHVDNYPFTSSVCRACFGSLSLRPPPPKKECPWRSCLRRRAARGRPREKGMPVVVLFAKRGCPTPPPRKRNARGGPVCEEGLRFFPRRGPRVLHSQKIQSIVSGWRWGGGTPSFATPPLGRHTEPWMDFEWISWVIVLNDTFIRV